MSDSISTPTPTSTPVLPSSVPPPAHLLKPAHLQSLSTHFHTELDLLDRIVYKNQSQFRLNIFWRKVTEIRRLGRKVRDNWEEIRGKGLLESVGEETKANRESLKRFAVLVEKLHLALPKLHNALTLTIELTHFLPTVVVLLGITSRLWATSFILYDHLVCLWDKSFGKGTDGKRKGLRKLPEWSRSGSEAVCKDTTGLARMSVGATDKDTGPIISVPSLSSTMTNSSLPVDSPQSELGQVIERIPSKTAHPSVYPPGPITSHPGSSEAGDEDDTGVYIDGIGEAGEKISRDYFSLPINRSSSTSLSLSPSPSPSPSPFVPVRASNDSLDAKVNVDFNPESSLKDQKKLTDRRKVLKNDSSVPLVSSPLSRSTVFSPPLPLPAPLQSSSSLQDPSGPSVSSSSTNPTNPKPVKRSKVLGEPVHGTSKIKSQAQDSSSASSTSNSPSISITSTKSVKSINPSTTTAAVAVARTVPTKRKIDLPLDNSSDAPGGKEIKKKKKKKKGDEIDDIFG
ncbi:hypothetical protein [Phaffia rhodozyma]|uniref:Nucleolus and neural progenitor protein-like N-terminal domain-containing protein n=1 Tax=Phaffia rhodozyma TaxID=264483 RepID=A0A0F7SUU8_PHARH|nr:hypothetical protein [Phaffia rhodozyma]